MAPALKSSRTTRASTRAQTSKSYHNDSLIAKATGSEITDKNNKKRTKAIGKAKKTKKTIESEIEPETNIESAAPEETEATSRTLPTSLTITSPLVNKPITCNQYTPAASKNAPQDPPPFIFTHGAGGTLSAPAVVNFCTGFISNSKTRLLAFQGSSNLGARAKGFLACYENVSEAREVVFGGRSMGARAAVMAATEIAAEGKQEGIVKLVLVSYPLQGPKDVRDQILLDLPKGTEVLFVVGDRDAMCPLELLDDVRAKMRARSRLVVVRGADHGMNVRPASKTMWVGEETGRATARWLDEDMESNGVTLYVGEGQ